MAHQTSTSCSYSLGKSWLVCLTAGLFFFYEFFQLNIFDVINPSLQADFHVHAAELSWMSSSFVWANVLFLLPAGFILDHYPVRSVILSAMSICILGTIGFSISHTFIWAAFFHALTGIGNAFCFLACVVLVARWFLPAQQALVIGCIVTMAFLGGMMAHTPFAYLAMHWGWRAAMGWDVLLGLVFLILIARIVHNPPQMTTSTARTQSWFKDLAYAALNPQNWLAGLYTACLNLPIMVLCALWGNTYLQTVHGLPHLTAANIVSLIFIGSIFGCPLMGWLSDQQGLRKPIMIGGALCTGLTLLPLCIHFELSVFELAVIFFALGLFTSTQVISYPLIAESNPPTYTGSATGLASVLIMGSAGLAQVLFGWLMMYHSHHAPVQIADLRYAFWIFPFATAVALTAGLALRETHCKSLKNWSGNGYGA
ncbi:MAG: MFS transporter [Legionellales bacterium]|nr:MFS transporter [Legionellales bacterium]